MIGVPRRAKWCRHGRSSLLFPRFWRCIDSGGSWIGDGTQSPPCATEMPALGLHPPKTVLRSSNQSATSERDWGFLTVQGGVDPKISVCVPGRLKFSRCGTTYGPGMGPYILLMWSWLDMRTMGNQKVSFNRGGVGITTPCGEVSCVDGYRSWHVTLSCPGWRLLSVRAGQA